MYLVVLILRNVIKNRHYDYLERLVVSETSIHLGLSVYVHMNQDYEYSRVTEY